MRLVSILFLTTLCLSLNSCQEKSYPVDIAGLWELYKVKIDGIEKELGYDYLRLDSAGSFAVSQETGDFTGLYKIKGDVIYFNSEDDDWYDKRWEITQVDDHIILRGIERGMRTTILHFKRSEQIADLSSFEKAVVGKWHLYQIREINGLIQSVDMDLHFKDNQQYQLFAKGQFLEEGTISINNRHKQIAFVDEGTLWKADFFGKELRLKNEKKAMLYCLKRVE